MISPRYLQAHCQSRTSPSSDQSFVKELAKTTQEKKKFKKNAQPHDKRQRKTQQQKARQTTADKEALVVIE